MSFSLFSYQSRRWFVAGTTFLSVGTSIGFVLYAFQAFVIPLEEESDGQELNQLLILRHS